MRLVEILRTDRALLLATGTLALVTAAPLFVTPFLPLHDLPGHVGAAALVDELIAGDNLAAQHYVMRKSSPYWGSYLILWIGSLVVGPLWAAKVLVALTNLLLPLGAMRLMDALGRSPRLGLLAFALVWEHSLAWGFVAFRLAAGMMLFFLALAVRVERPRQLWPLWIFAVALVMTHAHTFALTCLLLGALTLGRRPFWRSFGLHVAACLPGALALLPWFFGRIGSSAPRLTAFHPLEKKLASVFGFSLNNLPDGAPMIVAGLAFAVVAVTPIVLAALGAERFDRRDHGVVAAYLLIVVCYLTMPMSLFGNWYVYPRYATLLLLFALFVPHTTLTRWRALLLAPGVAAALAMGVAVTQQMADFSTRARPFLQVMDAVEENSAVLTLTFDDGDPAVRLAPYNQFHAYIAAEKGGYDPLLFDSPNLPVTRGVERPHPPWNRMGSFSMDKHGVHYDYILVQGTRRDPLMKEPRVEQLLKAGRWTLYRVRPEARVVGEYG